MFSFASAVKYDAADFTAHPFIRPSVGPFIDAANPSCQQARVGCTLGSLTVHRRATYRDK